LIALGFEFRRFETDERLPGSDVISLDDEDFGDAAADLRPEADFLNLDGAGKHERGLGRVPMDVAVPSGGDERGRGGREQQKARHSPSP
jgi:hypothetical protein